MKTYLLIIAILMSTCSDLFAQGAGTALDFDGVDDVVDMGNVLSLTGSDFTVEVWLKTTDTNLGLVVAKHQGGSFNGYLTSATTS